MAIAFDAAVNSPEFTTTDSTTGSWDHTVAAGSDRYLIVSIGSRGGLTAARIPSSVTYDGVAMTVLRSEDNTNAPGIAMSTWGLAAPNVGTLTVLATWSTGVPGGGSSGRFGFSASFTGVDQTTPMDVSAVGAQATTGAPTVNITPVTADAWAVDAFYTTDASATVGAGQTSRSNRVVMGGGSSDRTGGSTEGPIVTPAATTMSWTTGSATWAQTAVALRPASGGPIARPRPTIAGQAVKRAGSF